MFIGIVIYTFKMDDFDLPGLSTKREQAEKRKMFDMKMCGRVLAESCHASGDQVVPPPLTIHYLHVTHCDPNYS